MLNEQVLSIIQGTMVRTATFQDIDKLVHLNLSWHKPNLPDTRNGFLSVTYNHAFFEGVIEKNDLLVFIQEKKLLGYVLVNTIVDTPHVTKIKSEYLFNRPKNKSKSIAYSYQILIDTPLQGTGFFYNAQIQYFNFFKSKYEIFVSTINKENFRSISAHKKANWIFIDTPYHYFIIEKELV